nr:immunoglobulin heavy chain junction region [Macaca mulatta]MOV53648.1 immunoglobulin heavy chain junction region [Macaca mulatta]MOV53945.1 immunoglobulin heavy chain junction region [Macaca mulatta]MOV54547.1 immunoglobulin heavy chain junction region [Macaca mulatta]MOV54872.1 immunoglobulin heavy chain junction region [Macaca mulatta]
CAKDNTITISLVDVKLTGGYFEFW